MRLAAAMGLALLASRTVSGQVLRGIVRDSATAQPVPGAVVVLLGADGRTLGRNLTNEQGRYAVTLIDAITRVQFLRIGFRPREFARPSGGDWTLDVAMASIPTLLNAVNVVDRPECPMRPDRAAAFALWEQTKAALLATVVAREANPPEVLRLHFDRRLASDDHTVSQRVRIDSASTDRPFVSTRSAATFVEQGFAFDSSRARWYSGPDAEVMLDDAFARGYCFEIAKPDPTRPRAVGLGFSRATRQPGHIDIEGTVWIDSVSRTLSEIVFRYVGLDARAERFRPGGRIAFHATDQGTSLIDHWSLRFPEVAPPAREATAALARPLEAHEAGGDVARARWPNGREWTAKLATLRGHVSGPNGGGSLVRLLETDYSTIADSAGDFEISNLVPGPYAVGVADGRFAKLGLVSKVLDRVVVSRDSVTHILLGVTSGAATFAASCEADARAPSAAILVARIVMADGEPAEGAHVEVRVAGDPDRRVVDGEAGESGLFRLCHTPTSTTLEIRAVLQGLAPTTVRTRVTDDISSLRIELRPPP